MTGGEQEGTAINENEQILEQFRQQWRQELTSAPASGSAGTAGNNGQASGSSSVVNVGDEDSAPPSNVSSRPASPQSRKAELLSRPPPQAIASTSSLALASPSPQARSGTIGNNVSQHASSSSSAPTSAAPTSSSRPPLVQSAVELYSAAVLAEREGRLNDALRAYRSAFRKDEHVDKAYHRVQTAQLQREKENKIIGTSSSGGDAIGAQVNELVFTYQRTLQLEPDYEREKQLKGRMSTSNYVQRLVKSFRENPYESESEKIERQQRGRNDNKKAKEGDVQGKEKETKPELPSIAETLNFKPQRESKPVFIARLPDEILLHIASFLCELSPNARYPDMRSLERGFSLTCRKLRILTLEAQTLWRDVCLGVYRYPQMLDTVPASAASDATIERGGIDVSASTTKPRSACMRLAITKYSLDWRLMWIEQPRIRTDGVYISQITYLRRGASDASYYDPTHVITYYRYLVFLPSGDVVSLLSHDIPKEVVPTLLSSTHGTGNKMQKPGYTVGKWRLVHLPGATAASKESENGNDSKDASATIVQCTSLEDPRITDVAEIKYSFKLICRLKSTTRGKMNKLEMLQLLALNHRTGEEAPIPVKQLNGNMPSFYFSRVLSYD